MDDLHNNLKFSVDLQSHLKDICNVLEEKHFKLKQRVPHRWMSVYDCVETLLPMISSTTLFYSSWLPEEIRTQEQMKELYKELVGDTTDKGMHVIESVHVECQAKALTQDGINRKKRIVNKLLVTRSEWWCNAVSATKAIFTARW